MRMLFQIACGHSLIAVLAMAVLRITAGPAVLAGTIAAVDMLALVAGQYLAGTAVVMDVLRLAAWLDGLGYLITAVPVRMLRRLARQNRFPDVRPSGVATAHTALGLFAGKRDLRLIAAFAMFVDLMLWQKALQIAVPVVAHRIMRM